ncbi:hypothetical protein PUNSTDRAFT_135344 [Punctularia strigosozonata HHB-11173 SS5]|uniref:uncharacterized protein n=1 Tax=Punctularia strigosozonata (strain HHB-11173) TaxID=741275 RepID=UPI0004417324|nr:uncharacterized protein PUNSTDRAFT_135344 [Punctularia strigosozonata HHB-11173 SS5]EIN07829.1 hypothetical protein PUNSTDRAFT_135344 [Punctularia strigosozonata HHB-11173 SS5]
MSGFFTAEFGPIVGARFVGFIFATALWGVTCSQTWSYYRKSFNDHWALRSLVLFMWITDTVHEILLAASLYRLLILDFGNYEKLLIAPTTDSVSVYPRIAVESLNSFGSNFEIAVLFNSLTALEAQGFFLFRIYSMSHKKFLLTGALGLPLLAQFALGVAWSKLSFRPITDILLNNITPLELSYYAIAAVGDTILVIVSCYLLQRSRSGFERSDSVINKLMLYIVNAGLLTR